MTLPQPWEKPKKPWYKKISRWSLLIIIIVIVWFVGVFVFELNRYKKAIETGDFSAYEDEIVDLRQLIPSSGVVDRVALETFDDPSYGSNNPKVVIVEFADFGCPFCKQNLEAVNRIRQEYKETVRFIFRDFPVKYLHPEAEAAALAAQCANDQGLFWQYHDLLYARQGTYSTVDELSQFASELGMNVEAFNQCVDSGKYSEEVLQDLQDGIRFGVPGTPTFFINGKKLVGVVSYEKFKKIIEQELAR